MNDKSAKFALESFAKVKATAPEISQPGERVWLCGLFELKSGEEVPPYWKGLPAEKSMQPSLAKIKSPALWPSAIWNQIIQTDPLP